MEDELKRDVQEKGRDLNRESVINFITDTGGRRFEDRTGPVAKRSNFTPGKHVQQQYPKQGKILESLNGSIL